MAPNAGESAITPHAGEAQGSVAERAPLKTPARVGGRAPVSHQPAMCCPIYGR